MTTQVESAITRANEQIEQLNENPPAPPKRPPSLTPARDPLDRLDATAIWRDRADALLTPHPDTGLDMGM